MPHAAPVKRSEVQLVVAIVACGLLVVIALMSRRYSAAAALTSTMQVEQHSVGVDTTGWVMVDGIRHAFAASGPTNFAVSGRVLRFHMEKIGGTNVLDITMTGPRFKHRPPRPPVQVDGWVTCPNPIRHGMKFWQADARPDERLHWLF